MRFIALIASCWPLAPLAELGEATNSWYGATYDEVVLRWARRCAVPSSTTAAMSIPGFPKAQAPGARSAVVGIGIGSGGVASVPGDVRTSGGEPQRCERTLIFKAGRVDEQTWQGRRLLQDVPRDVLPTR